MTTITDDERDLREWAETISKTWPDAKEVRRARTILALLDRPTMPDAVDIADAVIDRMVSDYTANAGSARGRMRFALIGLRDALTQPAEPPSVKDAALALNAAVDAMWNNCKPPTPDHYVKVVCAAQQDLKRAMEADRDQ